MLFADKLLLEIEIKQAMAQQKIRNMNQGLKGTEKQLRAVKRSMLGFGLSALFTGMAIKRLGDAVLKSLVKTYLTATDEQSRFNQQLIGVQAGFEFLKFSIVDALSQSDLVIGFIEGIIQLTNRISEFISKHPKVALLIGLFTGGAIIGGGLLQVIGQTTLGVIGLIEGYNLLKIGMEKVMALKIIKFFKELTFWSWASAAPWIVLTLIIAAIIFFFIKLREQTGSVKNAFTAMGLTLLQILAFIGDAIWEFMIAPIRLVILAINLLIAGWNAIANTKLGKKAGLQVIETIKQPTFAPLSKRVIGLGQEFMARVEAEKEERRISETTSQVTNIVVEGDVTEQGLLDRIVGIYDARIEEINDRNNGTPTGG